MADSRSSAENVSKGLLFAMGAIPLGVVATIAIWAAGFVASLSSFAMAWGAVKLYEMGAGSRADRGAFGLIAIIVIGVVVSIASFIAYDANDVYNAGVEALAGQDVDIPARMTFIREYITDSEILGEYTRDIVMFLIFAGLGVFWQLRAILETKFNR